MRRMILALPLVLVVLTSLHAAEDGIPRQTLQQLKRATVFVKVQAGREGGTGSGFLLKVEGETGYLVTNHHVVALKRRQVPPGVSINLVFQSGTKNECTVPAEVVASDADRDLAILKVKGVKNLPTPLDTGHTIELSETMTVYSLGFPFGEALSTTKGNPALTVGKATISSIRTDERDEIVRVQLDGELNPGNSGGPVVDGKGQLVGVAVSKIRSTRIAFAIPPLHLERMLQGRVETVAITPLKVAQGKAQMKVVTGLIDPMDRMKAVAVYCVRAEDLKTPPKADSKGIWKALPGAMKIELKKQQQKAEATFELQCDKPARVNYLVQTMYTTGDGRTIFTEPSPLRVDFSATTTLGTRPPDPKDPTGKTTGDSHVGEVKTIGELSVIELKLPTKNVPSCLCWSVDGKAFFHLEAQTGVVRRLNLSDCKETRKLEIGRKCSWLSISKEGLLVTVADIQEAWVLDPETLKVKQKLEMGGLKYTVSGPQSSIAVGANHRGDKLAVFDLVKGQLVKEYDNAVFNVRGGVGMSNPKMTPNGKYLFTTGGIEQVYRFRIEEKELRFEESSQRIIQGRFEGLVVSDEFVCAPSGGGNYQGLDNHPEVTPYSTYIYPVTSFRKPAFTLAQGAYPLAVGFDPKVGLVYAQNFQNSLLIFNATGVKLKEWKVGEGGTKQFLVHPEGRRVLVFTDNQICLVDLPKK